MRPSTSSYLRRFHEEAKTDASVYDLGWRWSRQKHPHVLRSHTAEHRGNCLAPFKDPPSSRRKGPHTGSVDDPIASHLRAATSVYGVTASPTRDFKSPMSLTLPGHYGSNSRRVYTDTPELSSQSAKCRNLSKGGRRESANLSFLRTVPAGSMLSSDRCLDPVPSAPLSTVRLDAITTRGTLVRPKRLKSADSSAYLPQQQMTPACTLIPPPQPQDVGKLVVVLDLDETLVYSRNVTVYKRPGLLELLKVLKGKCEVIVWTAGTREYALSVIRTIDPLQAVQYCIYRHSIWWSGDVGCTKDLRLLGRPMNRVILIDNTPSVFLANPRNSILVRDFTVPCWRVSNAQEKALFVLAEIFEYVFRHISAPCAADVLASKHISQQLIPLDRGGSLELNVLTAV